MSNVREHRVGSRPHPPFSSSALPLIATIGVGMFGCGDGGAAARIAVRDSSGIRIIENPAEPPSPLGWRFADEPTVDIGGETVDTEAQLFRVAGAVRLSDGRIVIGDGGSSTSSIYFVPIERGFTTYQPFFHRQSYRVAAGDRVVIADSDRYELRVLAPDGPTVSLVRRNTTPRAVTPADVANAREQRLVDSDEDSRLARVLADMPVPEMMPAFGRVHADDGGNLWVENYRAPGEDDVAWSVFDAEGRLLTMLPGRTGFNPTHISVDFVLGTWRDELDVEHVRLFGLSR